MWGVADRHVSVEAAIPVMEGKARRRIVRASLAVACAWAVLVAWRYVMVAGFPRVPAAGLACALFGGAVATALGWWVARRTAAAAIATLALLSAAVAAWWIPQVAAALRPLLVLEDGAAAWVALLAAAGAGAGFRLGGAIGGAADSAWFGRAFAVFCAVPVLLGTLVAGAGLRLLAVVWLGVIAHATGRVLLRRATGLTVTAVGFAVWIAVTLALGTLGMCSRAVLFGVLGVTTVLLWRHVVASVSALRFDPPPSYVGAAARAALVALIGIYWIAALAPEVGPDALGFRTAGPVHWLRAGAIRPLPEMTGSYGACAGEMLYLLALPALGVPVGKIVQLLLGVLILASMRREPFAAERAGHAALWPLMFCGSTLLWVQFAWGFVDVTQLFFMYAAVLAVWHWRRSARDPGWLWAAGLCAGTAAAVKLNGGIAAVVVGVLWVGPSFRAGWRALLADSLRLGGGVLAGLGPWLVRSWWVAGNPVFPFANRLFRSPLIDVEPPSHSFGVGTALPDLARLPWTLFFDPGKFVEVGAYHPALLALLPLGVAALLLRRSAAGSGANMPWWIAAVVAGGCWALTEQNARYSLFVLLFATVALGLGIESWRRRLGPTGGGLLGVAVLGLCLAGFGSMVARKESWLWRGIRGPALPAAVVLGDEPIDRYLAVHRETYTSARWLNDAHGAAARVLQVYGLRDHLYFEAPATSLVHGIRSLIDPMNALFEPGGWRDDATAHRALCQHGYTHVLYSTLDVRLNGLPDSRRTGLFRPAFTDRYLEPCFAAAALPALRLRAAPRAADQPPPPRRDVWPVTADPLRDWNVAGGQPRAEDGVLVLPAGTQLTRAITVRAGTLYALSVDGTVDPGGAFTVQINWLDAADRLLLFWRRAVVPECPGRFEFWQTAPQGASKAFVYLSGGVARVRAVQVQEIGGP
ncbi:MAG: hypothetical protein KDC87_13680 [Planctomycetes bacterium]|nr:hypothetical protein [Planctomycetota bacterium]